MTGPLDPKSRAHCLPITPGTPCPRCTPIRYAKKAAKHRDDMPVQIGMPPGGILSGRHKR